jgi:hypothetical protein
MNSKSCSLGLTDNPVLNLQIFVNTTIIIAGIRYFSIPSIIYLLLLIVGLLQAISGLVVILL